MESFLWTSVWRFLKNLTAKLLRDPDMSLLGVDYSPLVTEIFAPPYYCCTGLVWLCMDGCTCTRVYMCACLCYGQRTDASDVFHLLHPGLSVPWVLTKFQGAVWGRQGKARQGEESWGRAVAREIRIKYNK